MPITKGGIVDSTVVQSQNKLKNNTINFAANEFYTSCIFLSYTNIMRPSQLAGSPELGTFCNLVPSPYRTIFSQQKAVISKCELVLWSCSAVSVKKQGMYNLFHRNVATFLQYEKAKVV